MIQLVLLGAETDLDIPETFPIRQLRKGHEEKLIQAGKLLHLVMTLVTIDTSMKCFHGQVIHHLRKNNFA